MISNIKENWKHNLTAGERRVFERLDTPIKIQDFLDKMPINFEEEGETYLAPRAVLRSGQAHCFEGALLAVAALHYHGRECYLLDLKTRDLKKDADHVVVLFREAGRWGAVSKTNHPVLRWRDPIYKSPEVLAYSYFHEYFIDNGKKTLISYSSPFDIMARFGERWISEEREMDRIALALDHSKHYNFYPKALAKFIKRATKLEIKSASFTQFKNKSKK